jgi:PDZ domain-containing protein
MWYTFARYESAIFHEQPVGPKEHRMRNVAYLGLCWATTLGLVAVALGQQSTGTWQNGPASPTPTIDTTGVPLPMLSQQRNQLEPPANPNGTLIVGGYQSAPAEMDNGQLRGELGVWMGETGGPGVQILRVTSGSAAERAGLKVGDVILQVNGRGASSPQETAKLIRLIGIGKPGNLMVWRDGNQQQLQVTLQPVGRMVNESSHRVGFGHSEAGDSDLASRTMRLEQQINSLTQELASLRQELTQLRSTGPVQTGYNAEANQPTPPQQSQERYNEPKAATAGPAAPTSPPPGFGPTEEKPVKPAAESPKPTTPAPAPSPEKPSASDLFESKPEQPKSQEKPKADDKSATDDLFK